MKKTICIVVSLFFTLLSFAQVQEPEFEFEAYLFHEQDSTLSKMLPVENAYSKVKAGASLYLTGIGKVKSYWYVDGNESPLEIPVNSKIVINTGNTSPMQCLSINKMEALNKKRRYQTGELGTFSGLSSGKDNSEMFKYKKYGKNSVIISLNGLEPGEYALAITNMMTNSKSAKIYTFRVGPRSEEVSKQGNTPDYEDDAYLK